MKFSLAFGGWEEILQLLFPVRCVGCRTLHAEGFCKNCQQAIPENPVLFRYPELQGGCGLGFYQWPLRKAVHVLKFERKKVIGKILAQLIHRRILSLGWTLELVTSVPLTPTRIRERGFNQARLLAKEIAKLLHLPCQDLLRVNRKIRHQIGLGRKDRRKNVQGAFTLQNTTKMDRKAVLLVDDVVTTGATIRECASTLEKGGAGKVYGACLALQELE